jgi:hypothetical protein
VLTDQLRALQNDDEALDEEAIVASQRSATPTPPPITSRPKTEAESEDAWHPGCQLTHVPLQNKTINLIWIFCIIICENIIQHWNSMRF